MHQKHIVFVILSVLLPEFLPACLPTANQANTEIQITPTLKQDRLAQPPLSENPTQYE